MLLCNMVQLYLLALLLAFTNNKYISGVDASATFTLVNKCAYTVWPGILSGAGSAPISTTGFALQQGESNLIQAPSAWGGRFWARTHCSEDSTGKFTCLTGDCGSGKIECDGSNAALPVTLAEFKLDGDGGMDFYDVSLVDGYNLPLLVVPQGGSGDNCSTTGCVVDLNGACPTALKVTAEGGEDVACKSACAAFNQDEYCCSGAYSTPDTCKPSSYSMAFKSACPRAYSYAYDDKTSTFTCAGADYIITFCPSPATSQKSSSGSQNQPPDGDSNSNSNSTSNGNDNNYFTPSSMSGTMIYDGAMDLINSGASSCATCMHVLRSRGIAGTVAIAIAILISRLYNFFF